MKNNIRNNLEIIPVLFHIIRSSVMFAASKSVYFCVTTAASTTVRVRTSIEAEYTIHVSQDKANPVGDFLMKTFRLD